MSKWGLSFQRKAYAENKLFTIEVAEVGLKIRIQIWMYYAQVIDGLYEWNWYLSLVSLANDFLRWLKNIFEC